MTTDQKSSRIRSVDNRFVRISFTLLESQAWRTLSPAARAIYLELKMQYNGYNNGAICLSTRDIAQLLGCGKNTVTRAMKDLVDRRIIEPTTTEEQHLGNQARSWILCEEHPNPTSKGYLVWDTNDCFVSPKQGHSENLCPQNGDANEVILCPQNGDTVSPKQGHSENLCPQNGDASVPKIGTRFVQIDLLDPGRIDTIDCAPAPRRNLAKKVRRKSTKVTRSKVTPINHQSDEKHGPVGPKATVWEAYARGFRERYGIEPKWNGKQGGMCADLIERIGAADAGGTAYYYTQHNKRYYVDRGHPLGALLHDCETLWMEYKTGSTMTWARAKQIDNTASRIAVLNEVNARFDRDEQL